MSTLSGQDAVSPNDGGARGLVERLVRGGLPALVAGAISTAVPIVGAFVLEPDIYQVWALVATLATVFLVFDFGAPTLAAKLASEGRLSSRVYWQLGAVTSAAPIVLGAFVALLWSYYARAADISEGAANVQLLIGLVTLGTAFRSVGTLFAAAALGRLHFRNRGSIVLVGAACQLLGTLGGLVAGSGVMSLGIGVVFAGLVQFSLGYCLEAKADKGPSDNSEVKALLWHFVRTRALLSALGLAVTQFDRWALGLVASASVVSTYDLAARFALMPKIALLVLCGGLVVESSSATSFDELRHLLRRSQKLVVALSGLGAIVAFGLCLGFTDFQLDLRYTALIAAAVCVGHAANSFTIPAVMIFAGQGRPGVELTYVLPLTFAVITTYVLSISIGSDAIFVAGWMVSMVTISVWFFSRSGRNLERVWNG